MLDGNTHTKNPNGTISRAFRILARVFFAALILPIGLVLVLHIPAVQRVLLGKVVSDVEKGTGLHIRFESHLWLPFSRLDLTRIKVVSGENDLLECAKAQLTYHFSSEWPYLQPDELYLENPIFSLEKSAQGTWQFPGRQKPGNGKTLSPESATRLFPPLPKVRVSSGTILVRQGDRQIGTIHGLNGTLAFKVVEGPEGPAIKLDLKQWLGAADFPGLEFRRRSNAQVKA